MMVLRVNVGVLKWWKLVLLEVKEVSCEFLWGLEVGKIISIWENVYLCEWVVFYSCGVGEV